MKYSYQDILRTYDSDKKKTEKLEFWTYYFVRPLSFPPARIFANLGISANTVTYLSIVAALGGFVLLCMEDAAFHLLGVFGFYLWAILDCSDGTVARATRKFSMRGEFLDALGGYLVIALSFPAMGILGHRAESLLNIQPMTVLYLGFYCSLSALMARLLFQKYRSLHTDKSVSLKPGAEAKLSPIVIAQNLVSITGLQLPFMIAAVLFSLYDFFLLGYAAVNTMMLLYTVVKTVRGLT
jgi:phosphatidylglycerophosphate synthase